jgi:hypothetical protein
MEAARTDWTDSRLDDLKGAVAVIDEKVTGLDKKVDDGFARLDVRIDEGLGRLDGRIDETNGRLDGRIDEMNHTMLQGMVALISIITVLLSILIGIIATKLFF